jgi:hypothetical protein
MTASVVNGTVVHGWCGYVEKSNEAVCKLMVINKLWIPDVLIDIIKDYLFVSATEVLRKFYRAHLNRSISDMWSSNQMLVDVYGRHRIAFWQTGHLYGGGDVQLQGIVCMTCGESSSRHNNLNGCCALMWDNGADGELELMDEEFDVEVTDETVAEINEENENEEIPEVTWGIDIPDASDNELRQTVLDNWSYQSVEDAFQEAMAEMSSANNLEEVARQRADDALWGRQPDEQYDYDMEAEMADYAEYHREVEMEAYSGRYER